MFTLWQLGSLSLLYVLILFAIAWWGDRAARRRSRLVNNPWTYSLALGVYCTSWTFFGAVGEAANHGWSYLPIYLGPIVLVVLGGAVILKIVTLGKQQRITSIADFIAARYGKNQRLAMLVTMIALVGVLPYIALQLKAVTLAFDVLTPGEGHMASNMDSALIVALLMAAFTLLFGTRHLDATEHQSGLMLAVAFESFVKLVAFIAVGLFCLFYVFDGAGGFFSNEEIRRIASEQFSSGWLEQDFIAQFLLAMAAIICLPRQFHAAVVENNDLRHLRTARWVLPVYLGIFAVLVLPIALAGLVQQPQFAAQADLYVLTLPMLEGPAWLTLLVFLGGIAAATGMVIVSTIAVAIMLTNEVLLPLWLRRRVNLHNDLEELGANVRSLRRIAIVVVLLLAFMFHQMMLDFTRLTSIGLLSFAAVAQFAPALFGGLYWRGGHARGAAIGLMVGFVVWAFCLLLPGLGSAEWLAHANAEGVLGLGILRPQMLFGLEGLSPLAHGVLWSLGLNTAAYVWFSRRARASSLDRSQATLFVDMPLDWWRDADTSGLVTQGELMDLAGRCLGMGRAETLFREHAEKQQFLWQPELPAPLHLVRLTERLLAGAMGASSARILLGTLLTKQEADRHEVARIMDEASQLIQFNHQLLRTTIETINQGICVVDRELNIVAWNRAYERLFGYPDGLIRLGRAIADVYRYNARRGYYGNGDIHDQVRRRVNLLREGSAHNFERVLPSGTVIEVSGMPMPGGGFVSTFLDITARKRDEWTLREINENLEQIVADRTRRLSEVNERLQSAIAEAQRANQGKTLFLAAAGHDLMQPLNAAHLFCSSLQQKLQAGPMDDVGRAQEMLGNISGALEAAESLISDLLDISRLDTGAMPVDRRPVSLDRVLHNLATEFHAMAEARNLTLRWRIADVMVHTDEKLLRRVLQNLLGNAVRYTATGKILLGCRRLPDAVRIEVWDTGPGITLEEQQEIFREFKRLPSSEQHGKGLGLGLAIAERICKLLGHKIAVRSWPGRGTVFSVTIPLADDASRPAAAPAVSFVPRRLDGMTVLCVDNDATILAGLQALLEDWDCHVLCARSEAEAHALLTPDRVPDMLLVDYQLDNDENGFDVIRSLDQRWDDAVPAVLMTANHDPAVRQRALDQGLVFLQKPVDAETLYQTLTSL
ncbi:hybrid sensor histidine kinase/response regulator [Alcanivorax sp. JB21]|uniref:hybrid sensor histidine kinase/response regulator n=1 Tax=Alcanivorax limicola TaxID=2874102 RepID=UPI001CBF0D1C|nr:PAS domain-containing hybrid sensor histidine kinase/response regulator [Alcanivorax limicola]MBZ2190190.1 hybrid sensor histidine kinase/response regulator [Alcanivorax limicola]